MRRPIITVAAAWLIFAGCSESMPSSTPPVAKVDNQSSNAAADASASGTHANPSDGNPAAQRTNAGPETPADPGRSSKFQPGGNEAHTNSTIPMVMLTSEEPGSDSDRSDGGILIREIMRQAYLIAARDELGVVTRDMALREPFPAATSGDFPPLTIHTQAIVGKSVSASVHRSTKKEQQKLLDCVIELPGGDEIDYSVLIAEAERHSRTTMVESLKNAGYAGTPNRRPNDSVPDVIATRLGELNFVSQFAAAKDAHELMREHGESQALVGALVRAYSNLGSLTQFHWSPAHKVFRARALLYAERMVAAQPESGWAYWHRAYARALVGFHAGALSDVTRARELDAKDPQPASTKPATPFWTELLAPYCQYDFDKLKSLSADSRAPDSLGTFLTFQAAESAYHNRLALDLSRTLVKSDPDCFIVWDTVVRIGELGHNHWATGAALSTLHATLPKRFATLRDLPEAVAPLVQQLTPDSAQHIQPKLLDALIDPTRSGRDASELSWSVLGRLIDDVTFVQILRRTQFLFSSLGVPSSDYVTETWPLVVSHPYSGYIRSYTISRRDVHWWDPVNPINLVDADFPMQQLIRDTMKTNSKTVLGAKAWDLMYRHADGIARDLQWSIYHAQGDGKYKTPLARSLLAVSPYSPSAMASLIKWDWPQISDRAAEWEVRFKAQPAVQWELGQHYLKLKQYGDAERCLRQCVAVLPQKNGFESLAEIYKAQGDNERWVSTLEQFLKYPDEGLSHARVRVKIADYYMAQREYAKALPYTEAAAETWAAWAMRSAAQCNEGVGDLDRSEYWWRNTAERYGGTSALSWYFWCRRTGQGDVDEAYKLANPYAYGAGALANDTELEQVAIFYLLSDQPTKARLAFQRTFARTSSPYSGLHVALLADAAGDRAERDTTLRVIVEKGPNYKLNDKPLAAELALASFLRDSLAKGETGTLDVDTLAKSLESLQVGSVSTSNVCYFMSRFLELHGDPDHSRAMLERAAASPSSGFCHVLARVAMRGGKQIPEDQQPVTVRGLITKANRAASSGNLDKAVALLERALQMAPNHRQVLITLAQLSQASTLRKPGASSGDADEALVKSAALINTLRQHHADLTEEERAVASRILYAQARMLARNQQPEKAIRSLRDAVDSGLDNVKVWDTDTEFDALRELPDFKTLREEAPARILANHRESVRRALAANQPFPFGFTLPDVDGRRVSLSDYKGKVVIVDIWGTWCPPCRMEVPHLVELFERYHDAGLEVIGVNYEGGDEEANKDAIRTFVSTQNVRYPCLLGDEPTQNQIADFRGFPTTLFIDRTGTVRLMEVGYRPLSQLEAVVTALLDEPSEIAESK
jgi:thiol-disulfide isomerase/thioredoxin